MEERLDAALVPDWEQPYKVPANWCWTTVKTLCTLINGRAFKPADWSETGLPIVRIQNLNNPEAAYNYYSGLVDPAHMLKGQELLFAWSGTPGTSFGAHIWWGNEAVLNQHIFKVLFDERHVDKTYLKYAINQQLEWLISVAHGGAGLQHVTKGVFESTPIPLPPYAEQQRIVDRIESLFAKLDEAKEKAQAVVDGYDARRAAILHKAFTGELTEKWRSVRGVKKDSWLNTDLSHSVLSFKYGTSEKSTYENTGMPVFRIPNVTDLGLSFEDLKYLPHDDIPYESQIHKNEILIIRSNGSRDLVGKSVLVPHLDRQYAYASFLIKAVPAKMIDPAFLVYYLNSADARNQMFKKAKSTAGINNINSKELGEITISIPPLQEQAEIVSILDKLLEGEMQAVETAKNAVGKIEQMKKAILARAFRGELGTNDPNDENAIELLKQVLKEVL